MRRSGVHVKGYQCAHGTVEVSFLRSAYPYRRFSDVDRGENTNIESPVGKELVRPSRSRILPGRATSYHKHTQRRTP